MDWDVIAPMIVLVTLILVTGGVIVLRPLTKRLADLVAVMNRRPALETEREMSQLREMMAGMESRLALMEERQGFTESLLTRKADVHEQLRSPERVEAQRLSPPA